MTAPQAARASALPPPNFYSPDYFRGLAPLAAANERAIWAVLSVLGRPHGYLDLGCGDGTMVQAVHAIARGAIGVELSEAAREVAASAAPNARLVVRDLRLPMPLNGPFSLVTCIDVVDWLEGGPTPAFWGNVTGHVSEWLVWTGGAWRGHLEVGGLLYCPRQTEQVARAWQDCYGGTPRAALVDEVLVFRRES